MALVSRFDDMQPGNPATCSRAAVKNTVFKSYPADFRARSSARDLHARRVDENNAIAAGASLFAADLCAGAMAFAVAYCLCLAFSPRMQADFVFLWPLLAWTGLAVLLHFAVHAQYSVRIPLGAEICRVLLASAGGLLATSVAAHLTHHADLWPAITVFWLAFPALVFGGRSVARRILTWSGKWRIPVIIVGDAQSAATCTLALRGASHLGYSVSGSVPPDELARRLIRDGWRGLLRESNAKMAVLACEDADLAGSSASMIEALVRERVPVAVMRTTRGLPALGCRQTWFAGDDMMMLSYASARSRPVSRVVKAALDVGAASLALLILLPLFLLLAALVKADGAPALFGHTRIGAGGRAFRCLKFRTMVRDGDAVLKRHLAGDPVAALEWAATRKLRRDPRVTRIGRILRKTSLDELPQLINVLRLEMSLVGPRPIVRREVCRYADDIAYYYATRPGITGLWQVSGRNDTSYARRVELDRWYVKNWTLGQDLAILARTLPAVMSGRGAS